MDELRRGGSFGDDDDDDDDDKDEDVAGLRDGSC